MKDCSETASTSASTITDDAKDMADSPPIDKDQKGKDRETAASSNDALLAFLGDLEEKKAPVQKSSGDFHGLVDPLNIQDLLEGADERKQSPGMQAREPPATVVLPTPKHLPSPTQSSAAAIQGAAAMPPAASQPSSDAMSLSASKSGSGNSMTSAITAGSSFSTPNKKAGKFTMKKFSSPSPGGNGIEEHTSNFHHYNIVS